MVDYPYEAILVADPLTFKRAISASCTVYDVNDTAQATPLALKDMSGLPLPNPVTSTADAFIPPLVTTSEGIKIVGGGLTVVVYSHQGLKNEAVAAREAAEKAAATAGAEAVADVEARIAAGEFKGDKGTDGANVLPTDTAIKDAIENTASATRGALNTTYGPQSGAAHLIVGGGQSNNTQSDTTLPVAVADDRLYKWDGANIVPLPSTETYLLPAFARQYANTIPKGDWIVIVPAAVGSTGFTSTSINPAPSGYHYYPSPGTWDRTLTADTNNFYAQMVSKTLAAKAAADAITAKPVTIDALLWSQGEEDTPFLNEAQYAAKLDDLIATFRTDVGDSLLPVIVGSMVPEYGYARGQVNTASVAAALSNTPARTFATAFAWGPEGLPKNGEIIHYSTQAQIKRGPLFLDGLYRARVNRAATKPVAPVGLSLVREASGQVTLRWEPPYARVTGYDIDFTFDGGTVWIPGVLDKDSRLKATSAALPWETVRARIRTKADGAVLLSDYAYSATLGAYEKATVGSALYFVGGENITAHTGAMTLYSVFTLPASGGEATINARSNDSTRQFYMTARQSDATDSVTAVTGGGTLFGNFPGNKATAGAHVNAAALAADGGALTTKRGTDAAATVTGTPGNVLAETLRVTSTGGTVVHGAYLFRGHAHDSATMASIQETLRVRHGLTRLGPL